MNTKSIGAASRIICEAMAKNRVPASIAVALDGSGFLHTVETGAELVALRTRVAELEAAQDKFLLPWAHQIDAKSLDNFVGELVQAADAPLLIVVDEIHKTVARWRELVAKKTAEAAAARSVDAQFPLVARLLAEDPHDSLHPFEPEYLGESDAKRRLPNCKECRGPATDPAHAADRSPEVQHLRALLNARRPAEDPHDSPLHHAYTKGRDLPEVPSA